jgi:hypothetical protein
MTDGKEKGMAQFMILLYGGGFDQYTPEQLGEISKRYRAWMEKTGDKGRTTGGAPLADEGKVLRGKGTATKVTDGPFAETKEVLGGYYFVEGESEEAVAEFCRDCPHLDYGGDVEVRRVIPLS